MSTEKERARLWLDEVTPELVKPAKPSSLAKDIESARDWLVSIGLQLLDKSDKHQRAASWYLDKIAMVTACAKLPGDMPLRVRLTPNVFNLKA